MIEMGIKMGSKMGIYGTILITGGRDRRRDEDGGLYRD